MSHSRHGAAFAALAGFVTLAVIAAGSIVLVRFGNGDFSSGYDVSASFQSASAGLHPGSQVEEDGVQIGTVRRIDLSHGKAVLTFGIGPQYRLYDDATATIEPENLFGADQVAISSPARAGVPLISNGGRIIHTRVLDELGQLFSSADPLLSKIDTADLSSVVGELSAAYGGQGEQIAASLRAGTNLAGLLARTTPMQLAALDALTRFSVVIEGEGPTLNELGSDANQTLPLFNAAANKYAALLSQLGTFANQFTALLSDYRPQIDTILDQGDNVIRVLLTQRSNVASLVQGLAQYAYRFGHGASKATLPDGSRFAYFKTFILWNDVEKFVCTLLAPPRSGLGFLKPLQTAVLSGNTLLNCSSELSAFDLAQQPGASTSASTPPSASSTSSTTSTARQTANGLYQALGAPQGAASTSISSYVDSLLPAAKKALP